jgi:ribosomal protein L24
MRSLEIGDRVEVITPESDKGVKGVVVAINGNKCYVKVTQAGHSHNTVKLIGSHVPYKIHNLRII